MRNIRQTLARTTHGLAFKTLLARQCGLAFERIRHAEQEKQARGDVELLY